MAARAAWMLVLVSLFWGLSFPLVKSWQEASVACPGPHGKVLASFTLIAVRYGVALAALMAIWPRTTWSVSRRARNLSLLIGTIYSVGSMLQIIGLAWTTPALSSFITSLGGAWVPFLAYFWWRTPVSRMTLAGLMLAIAGVIVLSQPGDGVEWRFGIGEILTLIGSGLFAVQIILIGRHGGEIPAPFLTLSLVGLSFVPGLVLSATLAGYDSVGADWVEWTGVMISDPAMLVVIGLLVVFSTILAFNWMNAYQPQISANRAALIYFLEPVFGTAFSLMWGYDEWSLALIVGGGLIIAGNILAEPALWRPKASSAPMPKVAEN